MAFSMRFLRAKHWQLFLLIFGLPMFFQCLMIILLFINLIIGHKPDPLIFFHYFKFFPFVFVVLYSIVWGWLWSIAIGLQGKLPQHIQLRTKNFKFFFFFLTSYLFLLSILCIALFTKLPSMVENGEQPNFIVIVGTISIILPLHFFSMYCSIYCLYFAAKTFKTVELQRETRFSDFIGEFFMFLFYPIGIWIIQPKINKMIET